MDFNFDIGKYKEHNITLGKHFRNEARYQKKHAVQFIENIGIRKHRIKKKTFQIINDILSDFRLPYPGEQLRIRTQQQINLISVVIKIIAEHETIDELIITTYTLNMEAYESLIDLLKAGKIKSLYLFVASSYNYRNKAHYEKFKRDAEKICKKYDYHFVFAWSHLKITLARCGENYYQSEGSMNYSTNNMAENLLIENDRNSYAP